MLPARCSPLTSNLNSLMSKLMTTPSYVIVTATAALALLLAGRPVCAQQLHVTLICHVGKAKIVHLEIIDDGGSIVIGDHIEETATTYPASSILRQEIRRLIEDNLHAESYQCSATYNTSSEMTLGGRKTDE